MDDNEEVAEEDTRVFLVEDALDSEDDGIGGEADNLDREDDGIGERRRRRRRRRRRICHAFDCRKSENQVRFDNDNAAFEENEFRCVFSDDKNR